MTMMGWYLRIKATNYAVLSASTWAVSIGNARLFRIWALIFSHFSTVLLARQMLEKASGAWLHLWATTPPTPPKPMISALLIFSSPFLGWERAIHPPPISAR